MKSLAEIREAIEKLAPKERSELRDWLDAQDIEVSHEFLAAVDEGIGFSTALSTDRGVARIS